MKRICKKTGISFLIDQEDAAYYKKLGVEFPNLAPEARQVRRLTWRNERTLYHRKCSASGEKLISIYHKDQPFPVYENNYWWSDNWNALEYGQGYDSNRSFFEQFNELQRRVPHPALNVMKPTMENSDYCNQVTAVKDCYMIFDSRVSERCMYGKTFERSYDCMDCYKIFDSECCYEADNCRFCYSCKYVWNLNNCNDCSYSSNLIGCSNCVGCVNLRNKKYHFFNKKLKPEEWRAEVEKFEKYSIEKKLEIFNKFRNSLPKKWAEIVNSESCTGDYLINCKNVKDSYDCEYYEDSR